MEVKEKPPTLTIVSLNDNSSEAVDIDQYLQEFGPLSRDESHPDLPLEFSEFTVSPNDISMVIAMSGTLILFVDGCWIKEVSVETWDRAEQRYQKAVKIGLAPNHRSHEAAGAPIVPWTAVTELYSFKQVVPLSIKARVEAFVRGVTLGMMVERIRLDLKRQDTNDKQE